jgi:hypothetical protein
MRSFKQFLQEKAPPGKKAEEWIKANKAEFKDRYGDEWEQVLYARAWKLFGDSIETVDAGLSNINEESAAASTTTSGVASPDSPPMFNKSKFMGHPCMEVDDETYSMCVQGKKPFSRWSKYVNDENTRNELKQMYHKNKRVLIKNERTGGMVFIK